MKPVTISHFASFVNILCRFQMTRKEPSRWCVGLIRMRPASSPTLVAFSDALHHCLNPTRFLLHHDFFSIPGPRPLYCTAMYRSTRSEDSQDLYD
jgi:hypothetical protein